MKLSEITAGRYAHCAEPFRAADTLPAGYTVERVSVLEVGVTAFAQSARGVLVRFDDGDERVVPAKHIVMPWTDFQTQSQSVDVVRQRNRERQQAVWDEQGDLYDALDALADVIGPYELGHSITDPAEQRPVNPRRTITLSIQAFRALCDKAGIDLPDEPDALRGLPPGGA